MDPQEYLEEYCDYDSSGENYYTLEESVWTAYSILSSGLVVPCMRDQNDMFSGPPELFDNAGFPFNIIYKYIPFVTLASQLISVTMAIVGYYSRSFMSGFGCFGLGTAMLPFSIGVILPVVSGHVKASKGNIPHANYLKSVFNFVAPLIFAAVGLPGLDAILPGLMKGLKALCQCCGSCWCGSLSCKAPDFSVKHYSELIAKYTNKALVLVYVVITACFLIGPVLFFIGNFIIIIVNAMAIAVSVGLLTYLVTLVVKLYDYRSLSSALSSGLKGMMKELLSIKEKEFDLTQSLHIMSPLAMVFILHGTFELVGGVYWGKSYSEVASRSLRHCSTAWAAVFYPSFGKKIITGSFNKHGLLNYAQSLSVISAIVHYFNEVVLITVVKYLLIRKAKQLAVGDNGNASEV